MTLFTIGYGGRTPDELVRLLQEHSVRTLVDVRLRPDRSSLGAFVKAKTPDRGIERVLAEGGIGYLSVLELGNLFRDDPDWRQRYARLLEAAGPLLIERLAGVPEPMCLMCAERRPDECHRSLIAEFMRRSRGTEIMHIE